MFLQVVSLAGQLGLSLTSQWAVRQQPSGPEACLHFQKFNSLSFFLTASVDSTVSARA